MAQSLLLVPPRPAPHTSFSRRLVAFATTSNPLAIWPGLCCCVLAGQVIQGEGE
jgi:hypothetical protein